MRDCEPAPAVVSSRFGRTKNLQVAHTDMTIGNPAGLRLNAMKAFLAFLILAAISTHAASDADVTIIKASKVVIEAEVITIVAEAKTRLTLIQGNHKPDHKGAQWMGRPVTHVEVKSDKATFTIRRPNNAGLEKAWESSLQAARDLQEGKEVGRIGFYAPDIVIKGNLIDSITGFGYLYPRSP
jgi:hypothetical protein